MTGRTARAAALCALVLAATSCTAEALPCTAVAALGGLSISVEGGPAAVAAGLDLTACTEDGCTTTEVMPTSGSSNAGETCSPEANSCSVSPTPDGTLQGFAELDLPEQEVRVDVVLRGTDGSTNGSTTTVLPARVYSNGEQCGGDAVQGHLVLDDGGLRPGP